MVTEVPSQHGDLPMISGITQEPQSLESTAFVASRNIMDVAWKVRRVFSPICVAKSILKTASRFVHRVCLGPGTVELHKLSSVASPEIKSSMSATVAANEAGGWTSYRLKSAKFVRPPTTLISQALWTSDTPFLKKRSGVDFIDRYFFAGQVRRDKS